MGDQTPLNEIIAYLAMYDPDTYGISLGKLGPELEALGYVEWVPPTGWSGTIYAITDRGKKFLKDHTNGR